MAPATRVLAAAVLLASLAAPGALAASTTFADTIVPTVTGHVVASSHAYTVPMEPGETIDAILTWSGANAARSDLDLVLAGYGSVCSVGPDAEPACLADAAAAQARDVACQGEDDPGASQGFGPGSESASAVADEDNAGPWSVYVVASLAVPGDAVSYTLDISTSRNGADEASGPQETVVVRPGGHCEHQPSLDTVP